MSTPTPAKIKLSKLSPRAQRLLDIFSLTEADWQKIYDFQKGRCAICQNKMNKPNVDHCHKSGKIRGLLDSRCNRARGRFGDSLELLQLAVIYLMSPPATTALGRETFGLTGRVGTKRQRKLVRKMKLQKQVDLPVKP